MKAESELDEILDCSIDEVLKNTFEGKVSPEAEQFERFLAPFIEVLAKEVLNPLLTRVKTLEATVQRLERERATR